MMETDIGMSFIIIISALSVIAASGIKKRTFLKLSGYCIDWFVTCCGFIYFNWETIMTASVKGEL